MGDIMQRAEKSLFLRPPFSFFLFTDREKERETEDVSVCWEELGLYLSAPLLPPLTFH